MSRWPCTCQKKSGSTRKPTACVFPDASIPSRRSGTAPVRKDPPTHDILGQEEAFHLQHRSLRQRRRDNNRDVTQLRQLHRRHHAASGGSDAVWQMGRIHERCLHAKRRQNPPLGGSWLPGNRQGSAEIHAYDPPQKIKKPPDPDCLAEGAQPPGQLHPGARRAFHRKTQEIRAPSRPVRRDRRPVQLRIQRDHRTGEPVPALRQNRQGSTAAWQVGDGR